MNQFPLNADSSDQRLLERAQAWRRSRGTDRMTREDLQRVTREHGVDFATAVLYQHFMEQITTEFLPSANSEGTCDLSSFSNKPCLVIAPGAFYREYPQFGSDGRDIASLAARQGFECHRIPTESLGRLGVNAQTIIDWFDEFKTTAKDLILVAVSKGSADVKVALRQRPDLLNRISALVSISGIPRGTQIANWLLERKRFSLTTPAVLWFRGLSRHSLNELCHEIDSRGRVTVEGSVPLSHSSPTPRLGSFHIVGFPLRKHLSSWRSQLWHRRFIQSGPSDGVILLADLLEEPGTVVPIWGADHYMRSTVGAPLVLEQLIRQIACARSDDSHPAGSNILSREGSV